MEESSANQGTEKIEKVGRNIINWVVYSVLTLAILGAAFWALFYSVDLANLSFIIPLRNFYQDTYWKIGSAILGNKSYPPFDPIYTIQTQKSLEADKFAYTMIGTFVKLNLEDFLIHIKGKDEKIYVFYIENFVYEDSDTWIKIAVVPDLKTFVSGIVPVSGIYNSPSTSLLTNYRQTLIEAGEPVNPPGIVIARWNDTRTLPQVFSDYERNPDIPLNFQVPQSFVLAEFN